MQKHACVKHLTIGILLSTSLISTSAAAYATNETSLIPNLARVIKPPEKTPPPFSASHTTPTDSSSTEPTSTDSNSEPTQALPQEPPSIEEKSGFINTDSEKNKEDCPDGEQCPINADLKTTVDTLVKDISRDTHLGNAFFNWSAQQSVEKRQELTEQVIQSLSIHPADKVLTYLTNRLAANFDQRARNIRQFQERNYNLFIDLIILHIYLNPMAGLQLPDFGISRALPSNIKSKLSTGAPISKPALSTAAIAQANGIEEHLSQLLSEGSEMRIQLKTVLLNMTKYSRGVPDLEENGHMYSLNLMLIAVSNDLYLYGQRYMRSLGKNLLNVVRSYDYMVCLAENDASLCEVYIVPGAHPSGLVIKKVRQSPRINVPARQVNEAIYRLKPAIFLIHQMAKTNDAAGTLDDDTRWYIDTLRE